jgi:ABC-type nitrate/sulfonate/bicarbonate transport system ATPase subunit
MINTKKPALFSCAGITKSYNTIPVIAQINLELPEGACVSLVGPSGVGKTTLFNILAGLDMPDYGTVSLTGKDITGIPGNVSYMLQRDLLLPFRTVIDNVILPLLIRGMSVPAARRQAEPFFDDFGLAGYERMYPRQLSGGMRQRAALLRTILMHNPVILLDEPFSALDAITRLQMHKWYRNIARAQHLSTVFITHDVDEALTMSDFVYILKEHPGHITQRITVPAHDDTFSVSPEFILLKKAILEALF